MTIRKRLARSNLIMILIPVAIAVALLLLGGGLAVLLLKRVYLPRLGLSMAALHETGEQLEAAFDGAKIIAAIYGGTVILALLAAIGFTNLYLTKHLFRHIQKPLDILVSGVKRIQEGNLDAPIGYVVPDEFKPACDAVDEMAARLKTSLEAQSRQQQKQELIAGMSHDLKSPLTSIRAYTEGLLDGAAKDEQTQARYLQTIYAKETELETLVNRLFSFAKLDLSEAPAKPEALEISGTFAEIAAGFEAEGLDVRLDDLPDETVMADRELLSRCMFNLLDNSRKYGASHVVISADISGDTVSISVSDDGPGVEASQLEKIFELGYRTDSARQIRS
ncbi:MAG: HAMP domain-containing histidine kinase [Firmicutes bacterium]|nr:HAMP domain-containing histidine kinase [Bacillota bacterium]